MEDFSVRGELILVEVAFCRRLVCGAEVEGSRLAIDPYEAAYREYRARHLGPGHKP